MNLPADLTLEQAYILGYEDGFKEATEPLLAKTIAGVEDGYVLEGDMNDVPEQWKLLIKGDRFVAQAGGKWIVDNGRQLDGAAWIMKVDGNELYDSDGSVIPGTYERDKRRG